MLSIVSVCLIGGPSHNPNTGPQAQTVPLQGLFVPFARVGSGDPVRVLSLLHNIYAGYN